MVRIIQAKIEHKYLVDEQGNDKNLQEVFENAILILAGFRHRRLAPHSEAQAPLFEIIRLQFAISVHMDIVHDL